VRPIPVEMWEWGIAQGAGRLRTYPAESVRLSLLPSDEATVKATGIGYFGCYYSCPLAIEEHWFDKARQKKTWKVRMSYDPRCMDSIWLHGEPGQPQYIACSLTDPSRMHEGKSLWEIDQFRQRARSLAASVQPRQTQGRVTLIGQVQSVVCEAVAMAPDVAGIPDSQRTNAIRDNRRAERQELNRRDALRAEQPDHYEQGITFVCRSNKRAAARMIIARLGTLKRPNLSPPMLQSFSQRTTDRRAGNQALRTASPGC
jgi:hypothetical protein